MASLDIQQFKQKDLVLKVNSNIDPQILDIDSWMQFIERLCQNRLYQKNAILACISYLVSNKYKDINDLVKENYERNIHLNPQDSFS